MCEVAAASCLARPPLVLRLPSTPVRPPHPLFFLIPTTVSAQGAAAPTDPSSHRRAEKAAAAASGGDDADKVDLLWVSHAARITFERPSKGAPTVPTTMTLHGVAPM